MMRGEVWWIDFDPSIGGEIRKKRPAIIMSNDAANHYLNRVQVVPITSNVDRLYPSEAYVTFRGKKSKAMADQITTVSNPKRKWKVLAKLLRPNLTFKAEHVSSPDRFSATLHAGW